MRMLRATSPYKRAIVIDSDQQRLYVEGQAIHISGQSLQILTCLLQNPGRVVRRGDLKHRLWPNYTQLNTNQRLNTAIRALRELLETSGAGGLQIETVRGVGYRLLSSGTQREVISKRQKFFRILAQPSFRLTAFLSLLMFLSTLPGSLDPMSLQEPVGTKSDLLDYIPRSYTATSMRAKGLIDQWWESPSSVTFEIAQTALDAMHAAFPGQSDVYTLLGELALYGKWDWAESEQMLHTAIQLDPENSEARRILAWHYVTSGRNTEAWPQLAHLLLSSNLTPAIRADLGWLLLRMGEHQLAQTLCYVQSDELHARVNLLSCRHTALARSNSMHEARSVAVQVMKQLQAEPPDIAAATSGDANAGYKFFLRWRLSAFVSPNTSPFIRAQLLAEAGYLEQAAQELRRAFKLRDPLLVKLHSTPEFAQLLTRPSISEVWVIVQGG